MDNRVIAPSYYCHPVIGNIKIKVVANARSVRARWVGPEVLITVPRNYPAEEYDRFIDRYTDRILEARPPQRFSVGMVVEGYPADFTIAVRPDTYCGGRGAKIEGVYENTLRGKDANYYIYLSQSLVEEGLDNPSTQKFINSCLINAAAKATARFIIPRARELADKVGRHPLGWDIRHARHSLGTCNSNGIITLGPRLIFLPPHLRDLVIFHELAHLSEMNHSLAFHQICNDYCHGHEAEYTAALRSFRFPVF